VLEAVVGHCVLGGWLFVVIELVCGPVVVWSVMPAAAAMCPWWQWCCLSICSLDGGSVAVLGSWHLPNTPKLVSGPGGKGDITVDCLHFDYELAGG